MGRKEPGSDSWLRCADRLGRLERAGLADPASGRAPVGGDEDAPADLRALWTAPLTEAAIDGGPPFAHSPLGPRGNQRFAERHLALPLETHRIEAIAPGGRASSSVSSMRRSGRRRVELVAGPFRILQPGSGPAPPLCWPGDSCRTLARSAARCVPRLLLPGDGGQAAPKRGPVLGCFRTSSTASSTSARPATIFDSAPEFGLTRRSSMPSATLPRKRS
jgi:hypothetical protein